MIDFEKELQRFHFLDIDMDSNIPDNEAAYAVEAFNAVLKRIAREQSNANAQLEELTALIDGEMEKNRDAEVLKERIYACENENLALVKGFIEILDQIENLYRYISTNEYGNRAAQIRLMWDNICNSLTALGIIRIDGLNTVFNPLIHDAKALRDEPGVQDGMILEVLRCGYIYKSILLRKSEVVVNKKGEESEAYEQDSRDRSGDFDF